MATMSVQASFIRPVSRPPVAATAANAPSFAGAAATASNSLVNPYPQGVPVAHTGPNNLSTNWQTAYYPDWGVWVANTSQGIAPLFTDAQAAQLLSGVVEPWSGGQTRYLLKGHPAIGFVRRLNGTGGNIAGVPGLLALLTITHGLGDHNKTGYQAIWYQKDSSGLWVPFTASSYGPKGSDLFTDLLIAGAIIAAVVVTAGAAGAFAAPAAGAVETGAAAAATTTAAAGGAAGGLTVSGVTGFVSAAASAAGTALKIQGLVSPTSTSSTAKPSATLVVPAGTTLIGPAGPVVTSTTGAVPPGYAIAPTTAAGQSQTVPAGTQLQAPDGTIVTTTTAGTVPAGYNVVPVPAAGTAPIAAGSVLPPIGAGGGGGGFVSPFDTSVTTGAPSPAQPATAGISKIPGLSNTVLLGLLGAAFALAVVMPAKSTHRKRR